jgi:bifunctional DNA-binding transcriptional regulator/antitoxin component of YhaV-PrlF toxin-antitoxin module
MTQKKVVNEQTHAVVRLNGRITIPYQVLKDHDIEIGDSVYLTIDHVVKKS